MPKSKIIHICNSCGYEAVKWLGRCPNCKQFNTFEENIVNTANKKELPRYETSNSKMLALNKVSYTYETKISTNISELDRVLTGGIVPGSIILLGGEPGIGKSTLLLQICKQMEYSEPILYVSGEESASQIKLRSQRLGSFADNIYLLSETSLTNIENAIHNLKPALLIIDSIQTMQLESLPSSPGSVVQVRESTSFFMNMAKSLDMAVIIVGHVTKEGAIAGPRLLEHMVDAVLYFEGERRASYRIIRAVKNRFGATNEVGVFEMDEAGLVAIANPSEYMLEGRPHNTPGSAITCSMEGSRPILTEVQALAAKSGFGLPRRVANGMDYNRVNMLLAVLEKRAALRISEHDVYVNIAGGMKLTEPSADLALVSAVAGSFLNKAINPYMLIFGEMGLTGEVRAVGSITGRIEEAAKLSFTEAIIPSANLKNIKPIKNMRIYGISNINELLGLLFS